MNVVEASMQTALISALTAAAVTLLIEYFAKPALEMRKDRLVNAARARRDMVATLGSFGNIMLRIMMAARNGDMTSIASSFKTLDDKAAKLSERHSEAGQVLTSEASLIVDEAIRHFQISIIFMESVLNALQKDVWTPEGQEQIKRITGIQLEMSQALNIAAIVYRPRILRRIGFHRKGDLAYAKKLLVDLQPKE
ncbi:hypothetical protein [Amycolatopsis vastitatis]|uniref:hypothetical protein n=1 Tax=Amycolatopsis vastitatis TaxID=1905142 RepID=UPI00130471B0|nr:hypothetical protein [Amycolatopsis vastitatis]